MQGGGRGGQPDMSKIMEMAQKMAGGMGGGGQPGAEMGAEGMPNMGAMMQ
jgi:hypothetical protein